MDNEFIENQFVSFTYDGRELRGEIIKIYTQIGFSEHGQTFAIIRIEGQKGLFNKNTLRIEINELANIARLH